MLIFRQLFDPKSSTYTYLLADEETREAVIIDPVFDQAGRDGALIRELGLRPVATLDTHVHADHVTGAWAMKEKFGSKIAISAQSGASGADRYLSDGEKIRFGERYLVARATPGHTAGCMTYVLDDESRAFTGDCLLIRGCGRTDFQQGSSTVLYRSVHAKIFVLPDECLLYPGHDYRGLTMTSVAEEKRFNPRLGAQASEADFAGYMDNLGLPHPKQMDIAVPANLACGRPPAGDHSADAPHWAPLALNFAGIWEISPHWLEEHRRDVEVLDVREPDEFAGPLGHIPGARPVPLGRLKENLAALSKERPIVAVCRSGARSAQATVILKNAGFDKVANLTGGMLLWRAQHHQVEGGRD